MRSRSDFLACVARSPETPLYDVLAQFNIYEKSVRQKFAQHPDHPECEGEECEGEKCLLDLFHRPILARNSNLDDMKVLRPLESCTPAPGQPAIVNSIEDFRHNFRAYTNNVFHAGFDWSNIIVAGGAVTACVRPVKTEPRERQKHYQVTNPQGDIDIFIYGLNHEQAIKRMIQIEQDLEAQGCMLVVRSLLAVSWRFEFPHRIIQVVLRIYQSPRYGPIIKICIHTNFVQ